MLEFVAAVHPSTHPLPSVHFYPKGGISFFPMVGTSEKAFSKRWKDKPKIRFTHSNSVYISNTLFWPYFSEMYNANVLLRNTQRR